MDMTAIPLEPMSLKPRCFCLNLRQQAFPDWPTFGHTQTDGTLSVPPSAQKVHPIHTF
jgi:hypothetical protein